MELFSLFNEIMHRKHSAQCLPWGEYKIIYFFSTVKKSTWFQGMLTNQVYRLSLWLCFLLTWGFIEFIVCLELDSRLMCPPSSRLVSVVALSAGVLFLPSALRYKILWANEIQKRYYHRSSCLLVTCGYCLGWCILSNTPCPFVCRNSSKL